MPRRGRAPNSVLSPPAPYPGRGMYGSDSGSSVEISCEHYTTLPPARRLLRVAPPCRLVRVQDAKTHFFERTSKKRDVYLMGTHSANDQTRKGTDVMRLHTNHWTHSGPQGKRLIRRKRYALLLFPASIALIFIMACGTIRTLEHAPANSASISVTIRDQYTSASQVTIEVSFADDTGPFALSGNQMLSCDGVIFPQVKYAPPTSAQLNRQLPGSAYRKPSGKAPVIHPRG